MCIVLLCHCFHCYTSQEHQFSLLIYVALLYPTATPRYSAMSVKATLQMAVSLCILQAMVCEKEQHCPPWNFTPVNATMPCSSQCKPHTKIVRCFETDTYIQGYYIMTTSSTLTGYPLAIAQSYFGLDRRRGLEEKRALYRKLPQNISNLTTFFCSDIYRQDFLCAKCQDGCGIAIYTYYGLPCAPQCSDYGIPLYLLLEIGFSTLFFSIIFAIRMSAHSSKWISYLFYSQVIASVIHNNPVIFSGFAQCGHYVPIILQSVYGIWGMDFLRLIIPKFCVSQNITTLAAMSCGYISALWPVILILLVSLAMQLHQRNFKVAVYSWHIINKVSCSRIQRWFAGTNLVHTFSTFFILSYLKAVFVSVYLLNATSHLSFVSENGTYISKNGKRSSADPTIPYFSPRHLPYAALALGVLFVLGVLLPLVLVLYPTRCSSRLFGRGTARRCWNAAKTFIETFQGSYKDGTKGTRDYRAVPALYLVMRVVIGITYAIFEVGTSTIQYPIVAALFMIMAAFFGLAKPYKQRRHNLLDVLINALLAIQTLYLYIFHSVWSYDPTSLHTVVYLAFLPMIAAAFATLQPLLKFAVWRMSRRGYAGTRIGP